MPDRGLAVALGAQEHYRDATLYDYEYRRRRDDVARQPVGRCQHVDQSAERRLTRMKVGNSNDSHRHSLPRNHAAADKAAAATYTGSRFTAHVPAPRSQPPATVPRT